jgi:hypothetical protein
MEDRRRGTNVINDSRIITRNHGFRTLFAAVLEQAVKDFQQEHSSSAALDADYFFKTDYFTWVCIEAGARPDVFKRKLRGVC